MDKREIVHVKYVGNGMVPVGGKMLPSGEIREVRRFLAEDAKRYHPETILILEDLAPATLPMEMKETVSPASTEPAVIDVEEVKDERQPEHTRKPAAKRRRGA
jgi:hypothetical protein